MQYSRNIKVWKYSSTPSELARDPAWTSAGFLLPPDSNIFCTKLPPLENPTDRLFSTNTWQNMWFTNSYFCQSSAISTTAWSTYCTCFFHVSLDTSGHSSCKNERHLTIPFSRPSQGLAFYCPIYASFIHHHLTSTVVHSVQEYYQVWMAEVDPLDKLFINIKFYWLYQNIAVDRDEEEEAVTKGKKAKKRERKGKRINNLNWKREKRIATQMKKSRRKHERHQCSRVM